MVENGYRFVSCRTHEHYPVLGLSFAEGAQRKPTALLFDTGSDDTYVSSTLLAAEEIDTSDYASQVVSHNGRPLSILEIDEIDVVLHDGVHTKLGTTSVVVVTNWADSSFSRGCAQSDCVDPINPASICTFRSGLISSKLLADLDASVAVDGESRACRILN